jgi:hypothetical protein
MKGRNGLVAKASVDGEVAIDREEASVFTLRLKRIRRLGSLANDCSRILSAPSRAIGASPDAPRGELNPSRPTRKRVAGSTTLPIIKGPHGRVMAIDLNRGEPVWMTANGDGTRFLTV